MSNTGSGVSGFDRTGQLKITLWELADFHHDLPVSLFAEVPSFINTEEEQVGYTQQLKLSNEGSAKFSCAYCFAYDGEREIRVGVQDGSGRLAEVSHDLTEVLRLGSQKLWLQLTPRGKIYVEMGWIAAPESTPENITVNKLRWAPNETEDTEGQRYFVVAFLNDEQIGRTKAEEVVEGLVMWPDNFTRPYDREAVLMLNIYREEDEAPVCGVEQDLWGFFKIAEKPCVKGDAPLLRPDTRAGGQLHLRVNFWDTVEEEKREARDFNDATKEDEVPPKVERVLAPRTPSVQSSFGHGDSLNTEDIDHAIDDARRAADAAAADAARAREIAELLKSTPMSGGHAADAVRAADKSARAAGEDAARAQAIADDLVSRRPRHGPELDVAVRDACDLAKKVKAHRDVTTDKGRDAAAVSARADARAARESHRSADRWARDATEVADAYPHIRQFGPLLEDAGNAAANAGDDARTAYAKAEDAEDADNLHAALEACKGARKAAQSAKKEEDTAEDAYKKVVALAKRADKATEKRSKKKQEEEEEALRKAKEDRERMRKMDHEADMARRRDNLLMAGDANEQGVYAGTMAYAFHGTADKQAVMEGPGGASWMCCGGSPNQRGKAGTGRRRGSGDSLRASIPAYELRGQEPIQSKAEELMETPAQGWCASPNNKAVPFAIFDDDGLVETLMHRRAQCWCFGCGCMRCCGEC